MNSDALKMTSQIIASHSVGATVQVVLDRVFAQIKNGKYPLDTRLPSERALAAELGVARNTVREALDVLAARKVINRRPGSGSFVTYQSEQDEDAPATAVAYDTSPLDHLVVRGILEPEMVRLAVINMSPRDINDLEKLMSEIEAVRTDVADFIKCEENIYRKIAAGTRNPLLASCYNLAIESCRTSFRTALLRRHLTPKRILEYQQRYNALFNAIASRDVERAVEFIKLHLIEEQKLLLQNL
ncbi:MAG TPA: FadR family transcriptional regulator [Roseobacter sp.]|uniref:HTH gntR-type domain-containing protein n=1 Tax=marine sediment metagenome TaxID=412755 RepID=A0A0F9U557_9ZZZZ|nr:FadR family transcriptional regulator [Roseobacter sp.]HEC71057.1 FadR family transcriptional regulator [Roseobacter sp.]|tara:strand:- start:5423 stop:6151 length:729 start_codon:yes stop_codon:yes gene_type:complete